MIVQCSNCNFIFRLDSIDNPLCIRCRAALDPDQLNLLFPVFQSANREVIERFAKLSDESRYSFSVSNPKASFIYSIEKEQIVIGRVDADISLDDPRVSRKHALIERYKYQFYIRDLDSKNGTFINGNRIIEGKLNPNDVISIGITNLTFLKT